MKRQASISSVLDIYAQQTLCHISSYKFDQLHWLLLLLGFRLRYLL